MDGISKMPSIFSRTVPSCKAFPKCLASPNMNRNGSQRNHPTAPIRAILNGLNPKGKNAPSIKVQTIQHRPDGSGMASSFCGFCCFCSFCGCVILDTYYLP